MPASSVVITSTSPQIRPATVADAVSLAAVQLHTVLVAYAGILPADAPVPTGDWLVHEWREGFRDPTFRAFLAEDHGVAVGTIAIRADPDRLGWGQLCRLHVLPDMWNRGVGSALYEAAVREFRERAYSEAGLWVLEDNARARAFYDRRGWRLVAGQILDWPELGVREVCYRLSLAVTGDQAVRNALAWFEVNSGWAPPDESTLADWLADGVCRCPDECLVAPEGWCEHGLASWKLILTDLENNDPPK
jgi:GNAT superfamily N-acetyltransferase